MFFVIIFVIIAGIYVYKCQRDKVEELASKIKIHWVWVKGHAGEEFNERVDDLARTAAESYK